MAPSATLPVSKLPSAEKSAKAPTTAPVPAPAKLEEMENQLQHLSFGPNALTGEYLPSAGLKKTPSPRSS